MKSDLLDETSDKSLNHVELHSEVFVPTNDLYPINYFLLIRLFDLLSMIKA